MIRSILAVLAGIVTLSAISFGIEAVVGGENKLLMSAYTLLSIAVGGYVTARIATLRDAVIMGAIETSFTIGVMLQMRDHLPLWAWIASIASIVPAAWCGAKLAEHYQVRSHR